MNLRNHKYALVVMMMICVFAAPAQQNIHPQSEEYQYPDDPLVRDKLEQWRDLKFGIILHWGLYAVPGIIESWELCSEDWINRDSTMRYDDYKKWYWGLKDKFKPTKFKPEQWAEAAKSAGMRYVVFTTKHHDGFCMFDTKQTDFKISSGPFSASPKSNVAYHVFDAFRQRDFMIGAYFSKPDWHSEYYWWPRYATPNRNNNYDIRKNVWRWNQFVNFTHNQIRELTTDYGKIDILWLDGGWVRPLETVNDEVRNWGAAIPEWSQDIDMDKIASNARKAQPGILVVDRTVHGPYENYRTPEQSIPTNKSDDPWESCITLGNAWGYVEGDKFKTSREVVHTLVEVVAKGGNLLLGVGPTPEGEFTTLQVERLNEIGAWMRVNGKAIYNTRTAVFYRDGNTWFTMGKDGSMYAIVTLPEGVTPKTVSWKGNPPVEGSAVRLLGTNKKLKWKRKGDEVTVWLSSDKMAPEALAFEFRAMP